MNGIRKFILIALLGMCCFSAFAGTKEAVMSLGIREQTKPLTLDTGEVVALEGMVKIYAEKSNAWVLILNYRTESLDIELVRKRAELIWPHFKPIVEKMGLKYAGIHAKKYPVKNPKRETMFNGYNLLLEKGADGAWVFVDDKISE